MVRSYVERARGYVERVRGQVERVRGHVDRVRGHVEREGVMLRVRGSSWEVSTNEQRQKKSETTLVHSLPVYLFNPILPASGPNMQIFLVTVPLGLAK
jgi:membrane protein implicated in regulation of membrane protease activity